MTNYYLDTNAHVPVNLSSLSKEKLNQFRLSEAVHGHPLAPSSAGTAAATVIEQARYDICKLLGISNPSCLCFTHSCTEANEWSIRILANMGVGIKSSPFEHPSMISAIKTHFHWFDGDDVSNSKYYLQINEDGSFKDYHSDTTICLAVQSEIGLISNLKQLRDSTDNIFLCDLAQAIGKAPIDIEKSGIDIATFGAHKFGGAGGIGCLYIRDPSWWIPYGTGTSYARDIPGTPNTEGIVITALALADAIESMKDREKNCIAFKDILEPKLKELGFDIICEHGNRINNTTFARAPNRVGSLLLRKLSDMGISIGLGSACGSFMVQDSHVMQAFGKHESNTAFIRISQHGDYGANEAVEVLDSIRRALKVI